MKRRTTDGIDYRAVFRARLVDRATRPWAGHHYDSAIARLDWGETVIAVPAWEFRSMGMSLPPGPPHHYDLHADGSITPSRIDTVG